MKELAIFYRDRENPRAIQYIEDNFYNILGDYINITNYYIDEMSDDQFINADVYIVCYEETLNHLVNRINDFSKVVVMTRCIQQQYLRPILEIPADTKVLVVNDSKESVLQTMYMIYELGIGHLSLIPFEESIAAAGGYADFDTAIVTCDSEHLVPRHIKNVYNIHNRDISFETFHKIISLLDLKNSYIQGNLLKKIREDMDTSISYIDSYLSNFLKDQMMNEIVDESSRAIVLLDAGDTIHYINEKAFGLFGANQGEKFAQSSFLPEELASAASFDGEMIVFGDNNYLAEKIDISLMEDSIGCCLIFQAEKDLRESESKLSRQLKQTGFYAKYTFGDIIHASQSMKQCIKVAKKVASSDYTILIRGDSGTGKELLAQSIHNYSTRKNYPFVAVNCAAIPENLLESELFGYEEGSFTGAKKSGKIGLFEHAHHGTIFLDEIGDISPSLQTRLLRVIQEKQIMRVGSDKLINIDARIIAATNADLEQRVNDGRFRSDLFYRLNVIALNIAPLRDRRDDILPLLKVFLGRQYGNLLPAEQKILLSHDWPGNVRELENVGSYYKILGQLPDYLSAPRAASEPPKFEAPGPRPAAAGDYAEVFDLDAEILRIIAENSTPYSGVGRGILKEKLAAAGLPVGEGTLKKHMQSLKERSLIESGAGRGGSRITASGLKFIK